MEVVGREDEGRSQFQFLLESLEFAGIHVSAHVQPISEKGRRQGRRVKSVPVQSRKTCGNSVSNDL